jgi:hypothetical protein
VEEFIMRKVVIAHAAGWGRMKPGAKITDDSQIKEGDTLLMQIEQLKYVVRVLLKPRDQYPMGVILDQGKPIGDPSIISVEGMGVLYRPRF